MKNFFINAAMIAMILTAGFLIIHVMIISNKRDSQRQVDAALQHIENQRIIDSMEFNTIYK